MSRQLFVLSLLLSCLSTPVFAADCYESSISSPTPFMGNNDEIFKLSDGSLWQVKYEYEYLYEYYPNVVICPSIGKLIVKGKSLNIIRISGGQGLDLGGGAIIESRIDGEFTGWEGETIFKLQNGQIWQQSSYSYKYVYKYSPKVTIYQQSGRYSMQVDGVEGSIRVTRLK